jgi:hypothetical protein
MEKELENSEKKRKELMAQMQTMEDNAVIILKTISQYIRVYFYFVLLYLLFIPKRDYCNIEKIQTKTG